MKVKFNFTDADVVSAYPLLSRKNFSAKEMQAVFDCLIDKREYADLEDWLADMIKSGIITVII